MRRFPLDEQTPLNLHEYVGMDIVADVIDENRRQFAAPGRSFQRGDLLKESLPEVDLIFCRDCLIHFSDRDVERALQNFKASRSRYLLTTTYPEEGPSRNIITGQWQPINLQAEPFRLPLPITMIEEESPQSKPPYFRKCLALWDLASIETG